MAMRRTTWPDEEKKQNEQIKKWIAGLSPQQRAKAKQVGLKLWERREPRGSRRGQRTLSLSTDPADDLPDEEGDQQPERTNRNLTTLRRCVLRQVTGLAVECLLELGPRLNKEASKLLISLLHCSTRDQRKEDPEAFNYNTIAYTLSDLTGVAWSNDQARTVLFKDAAAAYFSAWRQVIARYRRILERLGRSPDWSIDLLTLPLGAPSEEWISDRVKSLRKRLRSWEAWEAKIQHIYQSAPKLTLPC